jgi:hypothetical protein
MEGGKIGGAKKLEEHRREQGPAQGPAGGQGAANLMHVERACRKF